MCTRVSFCPYSLTGCARARALALARFLSQFHADRERLFPVSVSRDFPRTLFLNKVTLHVTRLIFSPTFSSLYKIELCVTSSILIVPTSLTRVSVRPSQYRSSVNEFFVDVRNGRVAGTRNRCRFFHRSSENDYRIPYFE